VCRFFSSLKLYFLTAPRGKPQCSALGKDSACEIAEQTLTQVRWTSLWLFVIQATPVMTFGTISHGVPNIERKYGTMMEKEKM